MDKKALGMAIFMGLYVPLFTGISVSIHRLTRRIPKESDKIIIVHRQFEKQLFDDINSNLIVKSDKSPTFPFTKDDLEVNSLNFYKLLPPAYVRDSSLLQNLDLDQIAIAESSVNLQTRSQNR